MGIIIYPENNNSLKTAEIDFFFKSYLGGCRGYFLFFSLLVKVIGNFVLLRLVRLMKHNIFKI